MTEQVIPANYLETKKEEARKTRWLTVWLLAGLQLTENSEGGVVNSLFPIIRAGLGIGLTALGELTAIGKFARMLAGPMWSILADRFGRKLMLIIGAMWCTFLVLAGFAQNYTQLLILYSLGVIGTVGGEPISNGIVPDLFNPDERGKVFGTLRSITGVGSIIVTPLMGQLAGIPNNDGWRYGLWIIGGINLAAAIASWFLIKDPVPHIKGQKSSGEASFKFSDVPKLFAIPTIAWMAVMLIFLTVLVLYAFQVVYIVDTRGYSTQLATLLTSVYFIGFTISSLVGGYLGDWFERKLGDTGRVTFMQIYLVLFAFMSYLAMQVNWPKTPALAGISVYDILIWFVFGLIGSLGFAGCVLPLVSSVVPSRYRASAFALLFSFIQGLLTAILAIFLGSLSKIFGEKNMMLYLVTIPYLINAVVWFVFYKTVPKDRERMRQQLLAEAAVPPKAS